MKKVFLLIFSIISIQSFSQCIPDSSIYHFGVYPDSISNCYASIPYDQTLTIKIPSDSTISLPPYFPNDTTISVDSAGIINIIGLPTGLSYSTNPNSGYIKGGKLGCLQIYGTPNANQTGIHDIKILINIHLFLGFSSLIYPDTFYYSMNVLDSNNSISDKKSYSLQLIENNPNPFTNTTNINFNSNTNGNIQIGIYNSIGELIYNSKEIYVKGINIIPLYLSQFPSGLYYCRIKDEKTNHQITKKLIKIN